MGILAELEKLNPTTIVADLEAAQSKILEYEARIGQLETCLIALAPAIQAIVNLIPGGTIPTEVAALLAALPKLSPLPTPAPVPTAPPASGS